MMSKEKQAVKAAKHKAWRQALSAEHKARIAGKRKAHYKANKVTEVARVVAWYEANKEKVAVSQKARREAYRWTVGSSSRQKNGFSPWLIQALLQHQGHVCGICKTPITENAQADHDHTTGKRRGLLCRRCNILEGQLLKVPMDLEEWASRVVEWRESAVAEELARIAE